MSGPAATVGKRTVTTVEAVPPVGSAPLAAAMFVLLVVGVGFLTGAALTGSTAVFVVALLGVTVVEILIDHLAPFIAWALARVGAGPVARGLLIGSTLVVLAVQTNMAPVVVAALVAVLISLTAAMARNTAAQLMDYLRRPPIMTRGLDLGIAAPPRALPHTLLRQHGWERVAEVPAAIGLAFAAGRRGPDEYGYIGLALYVVLALVVPFIVVSHTVRIRRQSLRRRVSDAAVGQIADLDPRIVLYFGDGPAWQYQVEVWLRALEQCGHRVLIVVRNRGLLQTLPPTTLPIVCVPTGRELMRLPLTSLRGALFVGNNSNNIHMLRRPGVTSVFLGHGDSDKDASRNPFSRAYNEIWVAGPAGRERYRAAGIGVGEHAFREIGRPQLGPLGRLPDAALGVETMLTVLYAPTWEGWGETPNHSSLAESGVAIVRALLARDGVRVMYRPHPRTGHIRAEMRVADRQIVELLRAAGASESAGQSVGAGRQDAGGDALDACLRAPAPVPAQDVREHEAERYWREHPGHRILSAGGPDLYATFRVTDVLIADVSSVVTDFLAADRPYAIVNNTELDESEFRRTVPAAAGGFVLGGTAGGAVSEPIVVSDLNAVPDLNVGANAISGLDALLAAGADSRRDSSSAARARARRYLLGPSALESRQRFRAELDRLAGAGTVDSDRPATAAVLR